MSPLTLRCRADAPAGAYSVGRLPGVWAPGDQKPLAEILVPYTSADVDAALAGGTPLTEDGFRPITAAEAEQIVAASDGLMQLVDDTPLEPAVTDPTPAEPAKADPDPSDAPADAAASRKR